MLLHNRGALHRARHRRLPVNDLMSLFELQAWKPVLTALLLPPVPWLLLVLFGARLLSRGRRAGWWLLWAALFGLWFGSTTGGATWLARAAGLQPQALGMARVQALKAEVRAAPTGRPKTAIVVLGGGRELLAPEYAAPNLAPESLLRLRYGLWLARATGAPVAFSGGHGWGQPRGPAEADIAAEIAAREFGLPLRWVENRSRDTRGNADLALPLLRDEGVEHIVLVTHGWHMRRALRAFEAAAGGTLRIEAAPMGLSTSEGFALIDWLPSTFGHSRFRDVMREWVGLRVGA